MGAGPNYDVRPDDWVNLEYIIADLCSRIIDDDGSFSDFIKKDGSVAYTGTGVGYKDEDDMASDSAVATASQQSIKAYVDNSLTAFSHTDLADMPSAVNSDHDARYLNLSGENGDQVFIDFDTTAAPASEPEGRVWWNGADHALNLSSGLGPVAQVPMEGWLPYQLGRNDTGVEIPDGTVVYLCVSGGEVCIAPANSRDPDVVEKTVGVTTDTIADGERGIVTTYGLVRGLDTSSWGVGDTLYVSPTAAGELTDTRPTTGDWPIPLCEVIVSDAADGVIFVKYLQIFDPDDIKNATGFPNQNAIPADIAITFDDGTQTLSIQPTGDDFYYWQKGVKYISTGDTVAIDGSEGIHYIYFDQDVLTAVANPDQGTVSTAIRDKVLVAQVYWDATNSTGNFLGWEAHGYDMSGDTHAWAHFSFGAQWFSGLALSDIIVDQNGSSDTHAQFGVETGVTSDEDLINISPTKESTTGLPIFYLDGASVNLRRTAESGFSVLTDTTAGVGATGRLVYNQYTGGAWQLTTVTSGDYVLCHLFATNSKDDHVIAFVGQNDYANKSDAQSGAETEAATIISRFPNEEFVLIGTVIFQTGNTAGAQYSNSVKARIVSTADGGDYVDWRESEVSGGTSPTSHPNLSGLTWASSGHTGTASNLAGFDGAGLATEYPESDYFLADGTRDLAGNWTWTGASTADWNSGAKVVQIASPGLGLTIQSPLGSLMRFYDNPFEIIFGDGIARDYTFEGDGLLSVDGNTEFGRLTTNTTLISQDMAITEGSITSVSGEIDFDDEDIVIGGDLTVDTDLLVADSTAGTVNGVMFGTYATTSAKFGFEAAENATGGTSFYMGTQAGYGATVATDNTGTGNLGVSYRALYFNTTGINNVAVGTNSLLYNTTGNLNTAVGNSALYNSTGSYGTAVGQTSFFNITAGNFNSGIGWASGRYLADGSSSLTLATQCTYLGGYTRASANSPVNETAVGYGAIGNGNNTVTLGNSSVTATHMKGIVGTLASSFGDGGTTNYTSISATGDIEPHGSATYKANGGNAGITQSETGVTDFDIVIEDGLITSFTKN